MVVISPNSIGGRNKLGASWDNVESETQTKINLFKKKEKIENYWNLTIKTSLLEVDFKL